MIGFLVLAVIYTALFLWKFGSDKSEFAIVFGPLIAALSIGVAKLLRLDR